MWIISEPKHHFTPVEGGNHIYARPLKFFFQLLLSFVPVPLLYPFVEGLLRGDVATGVFAVPAIEHVGKFAGGQKMLHRLIIDGSTPASLINSIQFGSRHRDVVRPRCCVGNDRWPSSANRQPARIFNCCHAAYPYESLLRPSTPDI